MQLLAAVSAVANDGLMQKPQIVREIRNKDGQVVQGFQSQSIRQVISPETAQELKGILEQVVADGTGKNAYIAGYRIAGKTGTAQKVGAGGYEAGRYIASFVGFAPANDPEIAMLVVIDEPQGLYYGGQIAAPVFGQVMKDVLQYLKIPIQVERTNVVKPNSTLVPNPNAPKIDMKVELVVPSLINMSVSDAEKLAKDAGLSFITEGQGGRVIDQLPKPGSKVPGGAQLLAYLEPRFMDIQMPITVPELKGKARREVGELLGDMGLLLDTTGAGNAVKQEPTPGVKVAPGTVIKVLFEAPQKSKNVP
jgi:stage V sporulation protein D (sporulation-specific penicillin-binding protein)